MAEFNFQFENHGRVPCDIKKTLGEIEVLKVLQPTMVFDEENNQTGEIAERPVECLSSVVDGSVLIVFDAALNDVANLATFEKIELDSDHVDIVPWVTIDSNAYSNYAESAVKIKASKFNRVGSDKKNIVTPSADPKTPKNDK